MKIDKIALVTGSGQGIGRATAVALSAFSHVIIADIHKVSGEETVSIINQKGGSSRFVYLRKWLLPIFTRVNARRSLAIQIGSLGFF